MYLQSDPLYIHHWPDLKKKTFFCTNHAYTIAFGFVVSEQAWDVTFTQSTIIISFSSWTVSFPSMCLYRLSHVYRTITSSLRQTLTLSFILFPCNKQRRQLFLCHKNTTATSSPVILCSLMLYKDNDDYKSERKKSDSEIDCGQYLH